jgi:hypothetical protein
MSDEISPTEIPASPVPTENQVPPDETPAPVPASGSPPPAAALVVNGEVKSERELQLEKKLAEQEDRAKRAEVIAAEWQDKATSVRPAPTPAAPKKVKRKLLFPTILDNE